MRWKHLRNIMLGLVAVYFDAVCVCGWLYDGCVVVVAEGVLCFGQDNVWVGSEVVFVYAFEYFWYVVGHGYIPWSILLKNWFSRDEVLGLLVAVMDWIEENYRQPVKMKVSTIMPSEI